MDGVGIPLKIHVVSSQIYGIGLCVNVQLQEEYIRGDFETYMNYDSKGAVEHQDKQQGGLCLPPIANIDFPKFDGSNSTSWFLRCNDYFKYVPNIPDAQKIKIACLNLEGRAAVWYKGSRMGQTELSWSQFVAIILARFESIKGAKILVELSKLKHTDSYDDYVDKFEELKDRLVLLNQGRYTEDHFIASFISGVCKDMQVAINLVEPTTLRQAIEFGREHLLSTQEITRKLKPSVNVEQNKQTEMEDLSLEFSDVSKVPTEFPPSKRSEHRIIFKPNRVLKHQFLYRAPHNHKGEIERILKEDIEVVYTPTVFNTLTERSFDPGGRHVFVVVFQPEMQVMCVAELVKTKLKIGVEGKAVDEKLIDRLIAVEHHWIYQDLGKLVSVNLSSRDKSALIDEFKVLDIMQVQEFEISIKQWGMMCFDFCSGGFKSKIGANFISLRPLPKPPPMSKFYNGDSVVLKRREESVNQTSKLVPVVKVETEERKMLSVLQFGMTFLCTEKKTDKEYACKYIAKRKLLTQEDVDDVRREVELLQHMFDNPSVVWIKGAYEDVVAVHVIIELYAGGEFFDRIVKWGHYSEEDIAGLKGMFKMIATYDSEYIITFKELKAGLKRIGANHNESETYDLRKVAYVDNNETIDYGEFVATAHALHLNKIEKEDHMFKAFSYFDKDENQYNFYLGGGTFDVSLFTIEEGILEVNNLLLLVVVEIIRCIWLDKMFDQPPPKPPYQFQHWSLGDKTHSRGEYCHVLGWSAIWGFT